MAAPFAVTQAPLPTMLNGLTPAVTALTSTAQGPPAKRRANARTMQAVAKPATSLSAITQTKRVGAPRLTAAALAATPMASSSASASRFAHALPTPIATHAAPPQQQQADVNKRTLHFGPANWGENARDAVLSLIKSMTHRALIPEPSVRLCDNKQYVSLRFRHLAGVKAFMDAWKAAPAAGLESLEVLYPAPTF